jgi:type I restriction enzyme R subunit
MNFNEAQLEAAIIALLGQQGFPHHHGVNIDRDAKHEVLIKKDLRAFLSAHYAGANITEAEITAIIHQLDRLPATDLYTSNKNFMKWLSDGFLLKREDRNQKDLYIQLLDYNNLQAMRQPQTSQLTTFITETMAAEPIAQYKTDRNIYKLLLLR